MKRDVLVEGFAASRLGHPRCGDSVEKTGYFREKGGCKVNGMVAKGDVKSKGKTLSLAGDDGGVIDISAVKRSQF